MLFESQLAKWKHAVQTLLEPTPAAGETMSGQATFDRHQSDCQKMLGVALSLQSRAQAARRRAHERPADRNKMQRTAMQDIQLCHSFAWSSLRDLWTLTRQKGSATDLPHTHYKTVCCCLLPLRLFQDCAHGGRKIEREGKGTYC